MKARYFQIEKQTSSQNGYDMKNDKLEVGMTVRLSLGHLRICPGRLKIGAIP